MVTRYTKAWPEEVIRYINENITADFESGTLFRNGVKIEGSLVNPKPRQYLAFGCRINGKFRILKVHQVIFYLYHGKQAKLWIDHIDGDPLNNAISNLREVTKEQNQANMIPRKKTKSGYKGVHPRVDNKGFWATIRCNGKSHYLGQFNTAEEAAKAYNAASLELHGKYGHRNFS
ncbi:endonuclease [Escherichia coli]|nr:endonuclease [Escherichia coli]